ncbi:hypothetical protein JTB14_008029 [Gonioctena quinquepunctata]|nr:hypothetical protein JTB14_008029 [Gonioctena quinquepunctata]
MPSTREQMNVDVVMKKLCVDRPFMKTSIDSVPSGILDKLSEKLGLLEKQVNIIKTDMHPMNVNHHEDIKTLTNKLDLLEKKILESPGNPPDAVQIIGGIDEIKRRENNILIFGIPDDGVDPLQSVQEIISAIIPNISPDCQQTFRMG